LFEHPPEREQIREEAVRLAAQGLTQRQIASQLPDNTPQPVVQLSLALHHKMKELGLESPYILLLEPPDDYPKLRRHKHPKYHFQPLEGYQPPEL